MKSKRHRQGGGRAAFTLLEVLLAVTIFMICTASLFLTFRTGIRAWESGHGASNVFQTARACRAIFIRDLNNVFYRLEEEYNNTFRNQMNQVRMMREGQLDQEQQKRRDRGRATDTSGQPPPQGGQRNIPAPDFAMNEIAIPVNLSFQGEDRGMFDSIVFTRLHRTRPFDDHKSWGLRRIRYYVEENTLYREESTPFGLNDDSAVQEVLEYYEQEIFGDVRGGQRHLFTNSEIYENTEGAVAPPIPTVVEPLADGIEYFDITYGYFRTEAWQEVKSWDSGAYQYRFPDEGTTLDSSGMFGQLNALGGGIGNAGSANAQLAADQQQLFQQGLNSGQTALAEQGFVSSRRQEMAIVRGQPMAFIPGPDNLPAYIAIQLGIRDPKVKGRTHSFTFFVSLARAMEEFDTSMIETSDNPAFAIPADQMGSSRTSMARRR